MDRRNILIIGHASMGRTIAELVAERHHVSEGPIVIIVDDTVKAMEEALRSTPPELTLENIPKREFDLPLITPTLQDLEWYEKQRSKKHKGSHKTARKSSRMI